VKIVPKLVGPPEMKVKVSIFISMVR